MEASPKVSVIIPLYNRADLVGETIDSVVGQTYENWELLIVDDGSNDGSYEYVKSRSDNEKRIKPYQRYRMPKGAPTCRNIGLERATGDYIIYLDSDDLLAPHCLQQRISTFRQYSQCDFLVFPVQHFEKKAGDSTEIFFRSFHEDYLTSFLLKSYWITISPIWKREALNSLGGFDESLTCMQDGDLHTRALIEEMTFKVFDNDPAIKIDGYFREVDDDTRISRQISTSKLDSKAYAKQKARKLLIEKQMLTSERSRMLAANFLNISWNYQLIGEAQKAKTLWRYTFDEGMVSLWSYRIGKSFINSRSYPFIKNSHLFAGLLKKLHQLLLPKYLLWL